MGQIPNGGSYACDSCHGKVSLLEEDLTPFGVDVNNTPSGDSVAWSALWNLDSDGDGFSNGLELGDPNGAWSRGQPDPNAPVANPGVANQGICGNLDAEPDEDCDTTDLRGATCESLGLASGSSGVIRCAGGTRPSVDRAGTDTSTPTTKTAIARRFFGS